MTLRRGGWRSACLTQDTGQLRLLCDTYTPRLHRACKEHRHKRKRKFWNGLLTFETFVPTFARHGILSIHRPTALKTAPWATPDRIRVPVRTSGDCMHACPKGPYSRNMPLWDVRWPAGAGTKGAACVCQQRWCVPNASAGERRREACNAQLDAQAQCAVTTCTAPSTQHAHRALRALPRAVAH